MARYQNEAAAIADGFRVEHDLERGEFVLTKGDERLGVAHYTLGTGEAHTIDFDHTFVDPSLRGTGLSSVLAAHALADDIVSGKKLLASCWFIAEFIANRDGSSGAPSAS